MRLYLASAFPVLEERLVKAAAPFMPDEKRDRLLRCRSAQQRADMALAEVVLAWALHDACGIVARPCDRYVGERGKPLMRGEGGVEFNVSHSGAYVLVGIDRDPIGVDIQLRGQDDVRVARKVMPAPVFEEWLGAADRATAFCDFWVRRECELKWWGVGIAGLDRNLSLPEGVGTAPVAAPPGYAAAVCGAVPRGRPATLHACEVSTQEALAWAAAARDAVTA